MDEGPSGMAVELYLYEPGASGSPLPSENTTNIHVYVIHVHDQQATK